MSKSYSKYTIDDIIRLDGGFLKKFYEEVNHSKIVEKAIYFKELAATSGVSVGDYSALDTGFIYLDQGVPTYRSSERECNNILSDLVARIEEGEEIESLADTANLDLFLETAGEHEYNGKIAIDGIYDIVDEIKHCNRYKQDTLSSIQSLVDKICQNRTKVTEYDEKIAMYEDQLETLYQTKYEDVKTPSEKIAEQLQMIRDKGRWTLTHVKFYNKKVSNLFFESNEDVVMRVFNPAVDLDYTLNFGKLVLKINLNKKSTAAIFGGRKNIKVGEQGYKNCHPNISSCGGICYGGTVVGQTLYESLYRLELFDYTNGILDLLQTYSQDTPYRAHIDFKYKMDIVTEGKGRHGLRYNPLKKEGAIPMDMLPTLPKFNDTFVKLHDGKRDGGRLWTVHSLDYYGELQITMMDNSPFGTSRTVSLTNFEENFITKEQHDENLSNAESESQDSIPSGQDNEGDTGIGESEATAG